MIKQFKYNVNEEMTIKNESLKGLILEFGAVKIDGTVCNIGDLNDISIDVWVVRNGKKSVDVFQGYLDTYLAGLYAQTTMLDLWKTAQGTKYIMKIDFFGTVKVTGNDAVVVRLRAKSTAFTDLSTSHELSYVNVESVPSNDLPSPIAVVRSKGIGNGEKNVDTSFENGLVKIVACTDYNNDYFDSTKAKFDGVQIDANGIPSRNVSQNLLEVENIAYLAVNPDTSVKHMVLLWEQKALNGVNLKAKLDQAADTKAELVSVHMTHV